MTIEQRPKNFALIGAAGYIAPRHMKAIRETGNELVAALDPYDGVGIMDSYFPQANFFIEPERFDRHLDKMRRLSKDQQNPDIKVDYVSICSPNYMHDAHIRLALRNEANAICEKPIVLNPWNVDALRVIEQESGHRVFTILQLRHHPTILALKKKIDQERHKGSYDIDLTYITSRGNWYARSWKGDVAKSGGVATNIGIHFFDMLAWIFGSVKEQKVHLLESDRAAGVITLEKANVRWFLSINFNDIPDPVKNSGKRTFRSITVNGEELEFSEGFTDLHTESYREILAGNGYGLADARPSIELAYAIREAKTTGITGDYHPLLKNIRR